VVRFEPTHGEPREVRVAAGTTLLDAARRGSLPVASACDAGGLCARCGLVVLAGAEGLSPESGAESEAKRRNRVDAAERLACRARVHGPVVATARYW
jgi:2Fe-2S ferredoxin